MPHPIRNQSVSDIIEEAVAGVVARLSRFIAEAIEQGVAKRAPARVRRDGAPRTGTSARPRGAEITRWVSDRNARRVPKFVIEATGLDTKKRIVAKYGEDAAFERGKPLPNPLGAVAHAKRARVAETTADAARTAKAKWPTIRRAAAGVR